jgi:hypothetical protein
MGTRPSANLSAYFFCHAVFCPLFGFYGRVFAFPAGTRRDAGHIKNQLPSQRGTSCATSGTGLSTKFLNYFWNLLLQFP